MPVLHAPSAALAATLTPTLTVEAEYGSVVMQGTRYTAAHHQPAGSRFAGRHLVEGGAPRRATTLRSRRSDARGSS